MNKGLLHALAICAIASSPLALPSANAALLLYDGFDYGLSNGTSLDGQNGGTGNWAGAWDQGTGGAAGFAVHNFTTTGLSYSTAGGTLATTGGAMIDASGTDSFFSSRAVTDSTITGTDQQFWYSYLVKTDTAAYELLKFESATNDGGIQTGFGHDNSARSADNEIRTEITNTRGAAFSVTNGGTIFVLGRITFGATGNATLENWYNIDLAETEGTIGGSDSFVTRTSAQITLDNFLNYRTGGGHMGAIDEIRLGDTFSDVVVVVPEPSAATMLSVGGLLLLLRRRR